MDRGDPFLATRRMLSKKELIHEEVNFVIGKEKQAIEMLRHDCGI
jgi:hypothetical protein